MEKLFINLADNGSVDGQWGDWGAWSACTKTCGGGQQTRTRECTPPSGGGSDCVGDSQQTQDCNTRAETQRNQQCSDSINSARPDVLASLVQQSVRDGI